MTKVIITKKMLDQLEYDTNEMSLKSAITCTPSPTALFVFGTSDLNAAAYHLAESLKNPFVVKAVVSVFLQESVYDDFVAKLLPKLTSYAADNAEVMQNKKYVHALDTIKRIKAKTIVPSLVCDILHEQLGVTGAASGVITLHTFRTAKEAIALAAKETLSFENASIFHENFSCAYELVAALSCKNFFLNCHQVSLVPLLQSQGTGNSYVTMDKSYHYETLQYAGLEKHVVFPIGTIFAN